MGRVIIGLLLLTLSASATLVNAAVFKWTDDNGTVTFRDTPPPDGRAVERVGQGAVSVVPPADVSTGSEATVSRSRTAQFPSVEIFTTSWCGYCRRAKAFLRQNGVPFTEHDVERDGAAAKRLRKLNPSGGVPVAIISGRIVRGFDPTAYRQLLKLK